MTDLEEMINRVDGMTLSLPLETDEDGYIDRQCTSDVCKFLFKVHADDWSNLVRDEEVFCPMCRKAALADDYATESQIEQLENQALDYIGVELTKALDSEARAFNRRQPRDSFISLSMSVKGRKHHLPRIPIDSIEAFQHKITCEKCKARFAVVGSAFFCPNCGYSSAIRVFEDSLKKIESKLDHIDRIREAVAAISVDEAAVTCRSIIESGLVDAVVAFQRVCEQLYIEQVQTEESLPRNVFQRIQDGSELWRAAIGQSYGDLMSEHELARLSLYFQRRHLLSHCEGIVDQDYIDRSGDTGYTVGQRITVAVNDVTEIVSLVRKLVTGLMAGINDEN